MSPSASGGAGLQVLSTRGPWILGAAGEERYVIDIRDGSSRPADAGEPPPGAGDPLFRILATSENLLLIGSYEQVFVLDPRDGGERRFAGDHVGDPDGGLIDPGEGWVASYGEGLQLLLLEDGPHRLLDTGFGEDGASAAPVVAARLDGSGIRLLVDPWSRDASTWLVQPLGLSIQKLCDGPFREGPWNDDPVLTRPVLPGAGRSNLAVWRAESPLC